MRKRIEEWWGAVFFVAGLYLTESPSLATSMLVAIGIHEAGHLLAFFALGNPLPRLRVKRLGLRLDIKAPLSYRHEALCALAGPLANLVAAAVLWALPKGQEMAAVHLLTALGNLLPITSLDGGRVLEAWLSGRISLSRVSSVCTAVSTAVLGLTLTVSLGMLWCRGQGAYLYFFFFSLLLRQVSAAERNDPLELSRETK